MLSAAGNKLTEAEGVEAEKGSGLKKNVVTDSWMEPGVFGVYYQSFANAIMGHACLQTKHTLWPKTGLLARIHQV